MAVSRPSAVTGFGPPRPDSWWGTPEEITIRKAASKFRSQGDFASSEKSYRAGALRAHAVGDKVAEVRYLTGIGACQVLEFQYRQAFATLSEARALALATHSDLEAGAIAFNLASLYLEVRDVDSALRAAEEGLESTRSIRHPYYQTQLLLQLGRIHAALGDSKAADLYVRAIEEARAQSNVPLEARAWDLLGESRLAQKRLPEAERALDEGFRISAKSARLDSSFSDGLMGALKLAEGDLRSAGLFTERALQEPSVAPKYLLMNQRGRIRQAAGDRAGALDDFGQSIELALKWRGEVLPESSAMIEANVDLARVFDSFVETAAQQAMDTSDSDWKMQAVEALELNRAASLRESLALGDAWRKGLPVEYWETLGALRAMENKDATRAGEMRLRLTEMEVRAGMVPKNNSQENFRTRSSLIHFKEGLSSSELFLSFFLGEKQSFVWAMTRTSVSLHRLPPEGQIREQLNAFRGAIREGRGDADDLGRELYTELLGELGAEERAKPNWLLSLGDALLDLPFAALVEERGSDKKEKKYLIEQHSLQIVPGASLLKRTGTPSTRGAMLAVGDPVYNTADPRWTGVRRMTFSGWTARAETAGQLARLVASSTEVESSARSWQPERSMVLEGSQARRNPFLDAIREQPAVIHLATHMILPPGRRSDAMIAFGIDDPGQPELLSSAEVSRLHVPGAVVVMTGCDSGAGEIRAGAGLFGLTRAWEMAGAGAVIDTRWPVRDSKGEIFASFYRHLRTESTADALRNSQMEMIHSGTWRAAAAYWASYRLTGSER